MAKNEDDELPMETLETEVLHDPKSDDLLYAVDDVPPWYITVILGLQNYLSTLNGIMALPYMLAPALCLDSDSPVRAYLLSSMMFGSGVVTILQAIIGVRLPIIQGGSFSFLIPIMNMMSLPEWKCPTPENVYLNVTSDAVNVTQTQLTSSFDYDEVWQYRMRTVQGSIAVASLLEVFLGLTGCIGLLLHVITPLTIVPTITLIGLSLLHVATKLASQNWIIAITTTILLLIFSQSMKSITIPVFKCKKGKAATSTRLPIFSIIPAFNENIFYWT